MEMGQGWERGKERRDHLLSTFYLSGFTYAILFNPYNNLLAITMPILQRRKQAHES